MEENTRASHLGTMRFWLDDDREKRHNQSVSLDFEIYGFENSDLLTLSDFAIMCKKFAYALGFDDADIRRIINI